jgi:cytochrome oxidase Cu insertion factor (SCO1/SenC/PrrC family)
VSALVEPGGRTQTSAPKEGYMPTIDINALAPDFTLTDYTGKTIHLSDFRGRDVLLVFNRGFI